MNHYRLTADTLKRLHLFFSLQNTALLPFCLFYTAQCKKAPWDKSLCDESLRVSRTEQLVAD